MHTVYQLPSGAVHQGHRPEEEVRSQDTTHTAGYLFKNKWSFLPGSQKCARLKV